MRDMREGNERECVCVSERRSERDEREGGV